MKWKQRMHTRRIWTSMGRKLKLINFGRIKLKKPKFGTLKRRVALSKPKLRLRSVGVATVPEMGIMETYDVGDDVKEYAAKVSQQQEESKDKISELQSAVKEKYPDAIIDILDDLKIQNQIAIERDINAQDARGALERGLRKEQEMLVKEAKTKEQADKITRLQQLLTYNKKWKPVWNKVESWQKEMDNMNSRMMEDNERMKAAENARAYALAQAQFSQHLRAYKDFQRKQNEAKQSELKYMDKVDTASSDFGFDLDFGGFL